MVYCHRQWDTTDVVNLQELCVGDVSGSLESLLGHRVRARTLMLGTLTASLLAFPAQQDLQRIALLFKRNIPR